MNTSRKRTYCSVFGCLNNSNSSNPALSLFTIPTEHERRLQWLRLIAREDLTQVSNHRVCEVHFNTQDIHVKPTRKLLKKNCLPCLHLPSVPEEDKQLQVNDITIFNTSSQTEISKIVENRTQIDLTRASVSSQIAQIDLTTASVSSQTAQIDLTTASVSSQTALINTSNTRKRKNKCDWNRKRMKLKSQGELNTSCLGENVVMRHNLPGHGGKSNHYCTEEAQSQPTTSSDQVSCMYIETNTKPYTDWLTETNKDIEEKDGTEKVQSNLLALEIPGAEQPSQKIATVEQQSTREPRPKKPKETDNLFTKRTSKRLSTKTTSDANQLNDVNGDYFNEFNVFGRFVATQLKNLNDDDAVLAQSEIQEVMIRYRLNKIKTRYEVPIENIPSANESAQPGTETEVTMAEEVLIVKCEPDSD